VVISIDAATLTAYYNARAGVPGSGATTSGSTGSAPKNPTPPWSTSSSAPKDTALVSSVLAGGRFINTANTQVDVPNASADYKNLFALYQGLNALEGVAAKYAATTTSPSSLAQLSSRFAAGMAEVGTYIDQTKYSTFQLAQGTVSSSAATTTGVKRETDTYTTGPLATGDVNTPVPAFQGPTVFDLTYTKVSGTKVTVNFDLSEMGSTPRSMGNVVNYLNSKLKAAGSFSTFSVVRTPGTPRTTTAGGQTVTLGTNPDSFALKFNGSSTETPAFSAPATAPAVYVAESMGTTTTTTTPGATTTTNGVTTTAPSTTTTTSDVTQQLIKFETDGAATATDAADGKIFANTLSSEIQAARASAVAPDGSVYVLTDVNATTDGQPIKGATDVALKKYDSAGNLVYTRTLGAVSNASGYALAVSADGSRVAVGGSVTGALDSGVVGADPAASDSFVSVFDAEGQDVFTQRGTATGNDQINSLSFGADGSLYVQGTASASVNGQTALGGQDAYVQAFAPAAAGAANAYVSKFTTQYGSAMTDKPAGVVVSGSSLYVAGVEAGRAVVRQYALQATGAPTLSATLDLGDLNGGSIAGLAVNQDGSIALAGTTKTALTATTTTNSYGGGTSAFVASLPSDLSTGAGETLTYVNGSAAVTATAMTVSGGKVYITGQQAVTPPPGQTTAFDGYAMAIDPATGATIWSQSFRGTDRTVAPTSIAVDASGTSVLDRLGLPRGTIDYAGSQQVTAVTSARAGDQFIVKANGGPAQTVTIDAADTLKTLAAKVARASGYNATVTVVTVNGRDQMKIVPVSPRTTIEVEAGKTNRDALESLGLAEGMVTTGPDPNPKDGVLASYSLKLPTTLAITDAASAKQAVTLLQSALSTVRSIYANMTSPPDTASSSANSGTVPAYLTAQIASYKDALARLTGSSG
jgi:hypothetical protein